ncbi:hypothetical protein IWQ61_009506 [Dispira simplex]|nr:hypothetical protein IWQ61_009506 [Dispira simplex]
MKTNVLAIALLVLTAFFATAIATTEVTNRHVEGEMVILDPGFQVFDINYRNAVSVDELTELDISLYIAQTFIEAADKNKDGKLNSEEFNSVMDSDNGKNLIKTLFQILDKDGSGEVSKEEFLSGLNPNNDGFRKALLNALFDMIDSDKQGFISETKLLDAVRTLKSINYPYDNTQA